MPPLTPEAASRLQKIGDFFMKKKERKESKIIGVRVGVLEYAELEKRAAAENLTVPSYIREKVFAGQSFIEPRSSSPSLDLEFLAQILGQIGKIGSNVNQIAKRLNEGGGVGLERMVAAHKDLVLIKDEILNAVKILKR
jgi:Bacterial mobilisation protein (MobC)